MLPICSPSQRPTRKRRSSVALGRSLLLAFATLPAVIGCSSDEITSPRTLDDPRSAAMSPGEPLATARWNEVTQQLTGKNLPSQNAAFRIQAYVTLAQHVSVEAIADDPGVTRPMMRGAVAGASVPVLTYAFPADSALIESIARSEEASLADSQRPAFRSAEATGRAIGARVVARARDDRFTAPWTGTVPVGPGKWASLAKPPAPPLLPLGGQVLPFFMSSGNQFRPAPPPTWGSPAFLEALAEVRRIADTRTPAQDSLAKYWAVPTGGLIAGNWNTTALGLIVDARLGERASAHALALINTAMHDALIACHDAKYTYWLIRPSGADTAIKTSVGVPNHPSYPSNHACLSGTTAQLLGRLFPEARERMHARANDASLSRLYGGIHYRFDTDAGLEMARKLSEYVMELDRRRHLLNLVQH
jgi:hypothetical protein